jgi:hypothetical protein
MRTPSWSLVVLVLVPVATVLQAQENRDHGSPAATPADLELQGTALGVFTDVNGRIARSSAQRYIESASGRAVRKSPRLLWPPHRKPWTARTTTVHFV